MPNVGYATIQIIPSVRGISDELRRQLVGPAEDAGTEAGQAAGGGMRDKLKAGAAAAGVAAGALLVAGISEAISKANITGTLQAQLGTSNKVAAQQGKLAGKLYSTGVSGSFQEAADAIKSVVQAGLAPPGTTTKQLEQIATKASDVANVFGQDLGGVTNAVSQMMRTGLAKNSTEAFDLITKGFQSGADKAGDLLDTVNEYGTQFRKAGLDGADAIGLLNQAIRAGARDSDIAADAIKEFSIRAVDGSKTSIDGFKALGLNADDMALKFAKGGKTANGVLDITLDKLRGIKDPVKQSQIAVQLFGTQAEDLGAALFAMDPSSAADGLGKVGGAAKKVGDTIRSGPAHEIELFTRALKTGFVDFIGSHVLPIVGALARGFQSYLLPPIRFLAGIVAAVLIPVLSGIVSAGGAVVGWLKDMGTWLIPIGILIAGVTVAMTANAIATGAVTAIFAVYRAVLLAGTAVTKGIAAAQWLWNAAMNANPIVLIVTLIVALVAAIVVAYHRSETFRNIVLSVWSAIQTAALFAWNNVLKPVFAAIVTAAQAVGKAAQWLWTNAIQPAFAGISTAAQWLYNNVIKPVFALIVGAVRMVGSIAMWLWRNVIVPAFNGIRTVITGWWTIIRGVFNAVRSFITGPLASVFRWIRDSVIKPVFSAIRTTISTVWNSGIKPVFNTLKDAVKAVGTAFGRARDAIKIAWDKLIDIAKKPVEFVVNTVYNNGIRKVWNLVAGAFGAPKLDAVKFARGGILPGYTPGRDPHKFYSPTGGALEMSGGEAIMRPEFTRAVGAGFVGTMNRLARSGGSSKVRAALAPVLGGNPQSGVDRSLPYARGGVFPTQRFADGGIFGWIKDAGSAVAGAGSAAWNAVKKGAKWLKDSLEASARAGVKEVVDPILAKFPGMDTGFGKMLRRIPDRILDTLFGYTKEADKRGAGGIGGPRIQAALKWARTQNGKKYQWGGNGNPSWDCSGFVSAIESVIRGQKPHRRWSTHAFKGGAPPGWVRNGKSAFTVGITHAGVGHTAGTLGKTNVESRGGDGVVVGKRARGSQNMMFTSVYGFKPGTYDQGGWLMPGASVTYNGTGRPEAVLTGPQWRAMATAAQSGTGGEFTGTLTLDNGTFLGVVRGEIQERDRQLVEAVSARRY